MKTAVIFDSAKLVKKHETPINQYFAFSPFFTIFAIVLTGIPQVAPYGISKTGHSPMFH
jgi:hypothetical protein